MRALAWNETKYISGGSCFADEDYWKGALTAGLIVGSISACICGFVVCSPCVGAISCPISIAASFTIVYGLLAPLYCIGWFEEDE